MPVSKAKVMNLSIQDIDRMLGLKVKTIPFINATNSNRKVYPKIITSMLHKDFKNRNKTPSTVKPCVIKKPPTVKKPSVVKKTSVVKKHPVVKKRYVAKKPSVSKRPSMRKKIVKPKNGQTKSNNYKLIKLKDLI